VPALEDFSLHEARPAAVVGAVTQTVTIDPKMALERCTAFRDFDS
jgi:hypothetical protein